MKQPTALALVKRARRRALLESLITALKSHCDVSAVQIRRALTGPQWKIHRAQLLPQSFRNLDPKLSEGLSRYAALIRKADVLYERAENRKRNPFEPNFRPGKFITPHNKAEYAYEFALEKLNELIDLHPGAMTFMDRPVVFDMCDGPTPDPDRMPRLINSRSLFAMQRLQRTDEPSRADKLYALQSSLSELSGAVPVNTPKHFSALDFDDDF